jgi:hypothetical protein
MSEFVSAPSINFLVIFMSVKACNMSNFLLTLSSVSKMNSYIFLNPKSYFLKINKLNKLKKYSLIYYMGNQRVKVSS